MIQPLLKKSPFQKAVALFTALGGSLLGAGTPTAHAEFVSPPANFTEVKLQSGQRNNIFYADEAVSFRYSALQLATSYVVRDYYGNAVAQGTIAPDATTLALGNRAPGWYKVYLYGATNWGAAYGNSIGAATFCVFRRDSHFPDRPAEGTPGGAKNPSDVATHDGVLRGLSALGPDRHQVYLNNLPGTYKQLDGILGQDGDLDIDQKWYLSQNDPARPRDLLIAFGNGTGNNALVSLAVNHYKDRVSHFEPRNEPQDVSSEQFLRNELIPFYRAVKTASPNAKVTGPGFVGLSRVGQQSYPLRSYNSASWLEELLARGGADYLDAYSFHAYNMVNGDLALGRRTLNAQRDILQRYGMDAKEQWQTEQGAAAAVYGVYAPRHQGRWSMFQRMLFEQYNIPKEHDYYWYDQSHGNLDFPYWFKNGSGPDADLNPLIPLMRVYSEEVYGKKFVRALDLGPVGNKMFVGNLFQGAGGSLVTLVAAGSTPGTLKLNVGDNATAFDAFGNPLALSAPGGVASIQVPELPIYIHTGAGAGVDSVQNNYGPNWARLPGTTVQSSGNNEGIAKLNNGQMETAYFTTDTSTADAVNSGDAPWSAGNAAPSAENPILVTVNLPQAKTVGRVIIYATPPHQGQTSLLDYDLQYEKDGAWHTLQTVQEKPTVVPFYTPNVYCTADTFYSDRWIFDLAFAPVVTSKIRLVVRDVTAGGFPTDELVSRSGGAEGGAKRLVLREIEVYPDQPETYSISGHVYDIKSGVPKGLAGVSVQVSGDKTASVTTDAEGQYTLKNLIAGGTYEVAAESANQTFSPTNRAYVNLAADKTLDFYNPKGSGVEADYYNATNLSNLALSRVDQEVNFDWGNGAPQSGIGDSNYNNFSARWTGLVQPMETGDYTFVTKTDNGVRLWIGGQLLVDDWNTTSEGKAYREHHATVRLTAFTKYPIKMEMWEGGDEAVAKLCWRPPSFGGDDVDEIIPTPNLYPPLQRGGGNGLKAEYFADTNFTQVNRKALRIDPAVNFNWGGGAPTNPDGTPLRGVDADNFSVRWTGFIELPEDAECWLFKGGDDEARLFLDGKLIAGGQGLNMVGNRRYAIKIEYVEHRDDASVALYYKGASQPYPDVVPQSALYSGDDGTGLWAQYYDNEDFTSLFAEKLDPQINFLWDREAPLSGMGAEHFSVRWTGQIKPWFSETYTFSTLSDEKLRLWVNGQLLIDSWTPHEAREDSGTLALQAGQLYDIKVEYADVTWLATARLSWRSPSTPQQVVPPGVLYPALPQEPVSVALTAPTEGAVYTAGDDVDLTASATPAQSVAKVAFYAGKTLLGEDTQAPYACHWPTPAVGAYDLTARAYDTEGNVVASAPLSVTVAAARGVLSEGTGLRGTYFDEPNLANPKLVRLDSQVDFSWVENDSPVPNVAPKTYSVRWEGQVQPKATGDWTFTALTDDGVRLWVDGRLVIDHWQDYPAASWSSQPLYLEAGRKYDIKLEYYQNSGDARARLDWSSDTVAREVIPTKYLYPAPLSGLPPTVQLIAPTTDAQYAAPASVSLAAIAADADGTVERVAFYRDGVKISETTVAPYTAALSDLPAGTYSLTAQAWDNTGLSTTSAPVTVHVANSAGSATGTEGTGLRGTYFDEMNLTQLRLVRVDSQVDFSWAESDSPVQDVAPKTYSVRWEGQVRPKATGNWTFTALTDDGVRLWINGKLVIDHWQDYPAASWSSQSISLEAGKKYDIKLEYYQNGGDARARLDWSSDTVGREVIPMEYLTPAAP